MEENLSDIFGKIALVGMHINLMQNAAVSFTVCLDRDEIKLEHLINLLKNDYSIRYNDDVELVTIRYYDQKTIDTITKNKEILMEQKTRHTVRIVMS